MFVKFFSRPLYVSLQGYGRDDFCCVLSTCFLYIPSADFHLHVSVHSKSGLIIYFCIFLLIHKLYIYIRILYCIYTQSGMCLFKFQWLLPALVMVKSSFLWNASRNFLSLVFWLAASATDIASLAVRRNMEQQDLLLCRALLMSLGHKIWRYDFIDILDILWDLLISWISLGWRARKSW